MSYEIFTPTIDAALHCHLFLLRECWPKVSYYIVSLFIRSTFITLIQNKPVSNCIEHEYEQFIFFLTIFASCKIQQHCVAGLDECSSPSHKLDMISSYCPALSTFQAFSCFPLLCAPFWFTMFARSNGQIMRRGYGLC